MEEPAERGRGPETVETELRAGAGRPVGRSQAKHHCGGQLWKVAFKKTPADIKKTVHYITVHCYK